MTSAVSTQVTIKEIRGVFSEEGEKGRMTIAQIVEKISTGRSEKVPRKEVSTVVSVAVAKGDMTEVEESNPREYYFVEKVIENPKTANINSPPLPKPTEEKKKDRKELIADIIGVEADPLFPNRKKQREAVLSKWSDQQLEDGLLDAKFGLEFSKAAIDEFGKDLIETGRKEFRTNLEQARKDAEQDRKAISTLESMLDAKKLEIEDLQKKLGEAKAKPAPAERPKHVDESRSSKGSVVKGLVIVALCLVALGIWIRGTSWVTNNLLGIHADAEQKTAEKTQQNGEEKEERQKGVIIDDPKAKEVVTNKDDSVSKAMLKVNVDLDDDIEKIDALLKGE